MCYKFNKNVRNYFLIQVKMCYWKGKNKTENTYTKIGKKERDWSKLYQDFDSNAKKYLPHREQLNFQKTN